MDRQQHRRPRPRVWHGLVVALVLAAPAAATDRQPPSPPPPEKGTLSGTVVDVDGKPVAGARVLMDDRVDGETRAIAEAIAGSDGRFRLGPVDAVYRHRYHLRVEADGFAPAVVGRFSYSVYPGGHDDLGTIRLDRGRTFGGRVLDLDGKPVAGAAVEYHVIRRLSPHPFGGDAIVPARTLTTDADGRFRTPPLPLAFLYIDVRAEGFKQGRWDQRPIRPAGEETLEPLRLEPDVPIAGTVVDERGRPVEGLRVYPGTGSFLTTDAAGRFVIRGHGRTVTTEMYFWKRGYRHATRHVERNETGLWLAEPPADGKPVYRRVEELRVVMQSFSRIEGRAVDDETGGPVRLDQVVLCVCERKPSGELVLSGCRGDGFDQPEPGRFSVPYGDTGEYHLTLSAAGYHDGEAFTPQKQRLEPIDVGIVRLRKKKDGTKATVARQEIAGTVTRDGAPVKTGWVGLWRLGPESRTDQLNLMRGRTVHAYWPIIHSSAPVRDGRYVLEVPFQHGEWYVVAEEPGRAPTLVGPVAVGVNERKVFDIACVAGGGVSGRVTGVGREWAGHAWVIAFNRTGVRAEVRVDAAGQFRLDRLPPGEYGLKVGHESYRDAEAVEPAKVPPEMRGKPADAWRRATVVRLKAGQETDGVTLELPSE